MRQNMFLLSAACFYFLIQSANLALATPAPLDTDKRSVPATFVTDDGDQSHKVARDESHTLEKRVGAVRNNLGQAVCSYMSSHDNGQISVLYKLYSAGCDDDKKYSIECRKYIPHTEAPLDDHDYCHEDEICKEKPFTNAWGVQKTEVYCQKVEQSKAEWAGATLQKTNCSPGVVGNDPKGTDIGFVGEFYSNMFRTTRATVGHAWIQSNRRGILVDKLGATGVYTQATLTKGEAVQACFVRTSDNDAKYAYLKIAEEDL